MVEIITAGLSIRFEVDGDIVKVDGTGAGGPRMGKGSGDCQGSQQGTGA